MTRHLKLSMNRPLVGVRARRSVVGGCGAPDSDEWVFDLRDRARREVERQDAFRNCLLGIDRAVDSISATVNGRLDDVAALATELGLALAREIVGAALDKGLVDPTATVARCLNDLVGRADGAAEVFLAPDDLGAVVDSLQKLPDLEEHADRTRFTADPRLERGAVRIETDAGRLLYEPLEVLRRISEEVRRELSK